MTALVRKTAGRHRRGCLLLRGNPLLGALIGLLIGHALRRGLVPRPRRDDPYRVLGLTDEATDAEIDLAYRRLIVQYHPDQLAGAADELRRQAETQAARDQRRLRPHPDAAQALTPA